MKGGLLYVSTGSAFTLPDSFSQTWAVHTACGLEEAGAVSAGGGIHVGLVDIDALHGQLDLLQELILEREQMEWIALVSRDSLNNGEICRMIAESFFDYHTLPPDIARLATTIGRAVGKSRIKSGVLGVRTTHNREYEMVGASAPMERLFRTIRKIAAADVPVLIVGESGTGKELTAQAIHERSNRKNGPFMAINCGALPLNLVQSELFGYEKGAFTGARERKIGHIEAASGGTLFLDEIGDLPFDQQVNLLRFLQERRIRRVGSTVDVAVDVRVIAATHVDLEKAVLEGRFREDLYYRLNVLHVEVPALRERPEDIEVLARFFFDQLRPVRNAGVRGFSQQALHAMRRHGWPGNVRELINRVRRAVVMCERRLIGAADLGLDKPLVQPRLTLQTAKDDAEHKAVRLALQRADSNMSRAARELAISRVTLYRLVEKYRINVSAFFCLIGESMDFAAPLAGWL